MNNTDNTDTGDALTEEMDWKTLPENDYERLFKIVLESNLPRWAAARVIAAARHGLACRAIDPEAHRLCVDANTALRDECNQTVVLLMKLLEVIGGGFRRVQVYRWKEDAKIRLHNLQTALAATGKEGA